MNRCIIGIDCIGSLDKEHIKTRGSGGSDHPSNIVYMCRKHHNWKGQYGKTKMSKMFPQYKQALINRGWEYSELAGKWLPPMEATK